VNSDTLIAIVVISLVSAGVLAFGLFVGYIRGVKRAELLAKANPMKKDDDLERLAGIGRAILGVQLKLDALCEVVYQQSTRLVDTRNFQLGVYEDNDYVVKVWVRNGERLTAQRFPERANEGLIGHVRRSAVGLIVGDYQRDWESLPAKPTYDAATPPRSALFAPLIATGEVIGVITVQSDEPDAFTAENLRMLNVLANLAAGAIRNAQLFEQTQNRARQLRLINEITRQITAVQPLNDLLRQIVNAIQRAFMFYAVNVFLYDEPSHSVRLGASSSDEYRKLPLLPGQGLVGAAYQSGQTMNAPDVTKNQHFQFSDYFDKTRSEICVPMKIEDRVLGVLDVQSDHLNAFNPDTVIALESLAGQLALALQEAQTYENEKRQSERVNAMADASRAVVSILNIDDLLDEVVDLVTDYFGYDRVHLFIRTGDRVVFRAGSGVHSGKWAVDRFSYHIDDNGFVPCVARNAQPLVSGEVYTDVHFVAMPGVEDSRSEMTTPIKIGNRVLGVFDIQSTLPNAFTSEDLTLMQALADTAAIGLRNASLFALETRRRILAETLREVSLVIASSLDLESVLDGILEGLERVIGYQAAMIALIDDTAQHYIVSAVRAQKATANIVDMQIAIGDDAEKNIFELLLQMEPPELNQPDAAHNHLAVALKVGGEQIGYMAIDRVGLDKFSPEEVEIVNTFAGQAAVAISNAQLYMAQREEAWVSNALLRVAEATGRATSLDEVLSTVARITPELAGVEWCAVFLYENNQFRIVEIEGVEEELAKHFHGHVFHDGDWALLSQLRVSGQPIMIDRNTPAPANMPTVIKDIGQAVLLPLYAKGEVMGAMLIGQRSGVEPLSPRKIELVSGIANQAALAIESAQLFAAQQEEQWVTTALLTVAESVNSTLGLADTMEAVVRLTKMLVGTNFCAIMQWEADAKCFLGGAAYGVSAEVEKQFRELVIPAYADGFTSALQRSMDTLSAGKNHDFPIPVAFRMFNADSIMAIPLVTKGVLVGAMIVDHPELSGVSDHRRMNILIGTAQQAALALETVRLQEDSMARQKMERELEVAQGIQLSFLPQQVPKLPGWDLSSFYRAARQVGGDFYDFIPLKSGKWGIVIADVADKGVPAALFMVLSRTNLRAAAYSRDDPVETLQRVNALLLSDSRSDLFVTVWYGVFDPIKGEMVYANGGHNPPLLIHGDGRSQELTADGIALGVINPIQLESRRIAFNEGDALIAYTDGVTEAIRSDNTEFGVSALLRTACQLRAQGADEILKQIIREVDSFIAGEPQFDDLTLIVLKRDGRTGSAMTVQTMAQGETAS